MWYWTCSLIVVLLYSYDNDDVIITRCMAKPSMSPPGILLFQTLSSYHYITGAKVYLLSVI